VRAAEPQADDPASVTVSPLAKNALRGVAWTWGGSMVLILAQVASTFATARLVSPSEFGLYASALAAAGFAGYFTMFGLGPGLQRRSHLGEKTVGTAMTLSLAASSLVALVLWIGASPWADAWGVPDATWTIRVVAVTLLLTSAAIVPIALLRHRLRFGTAAVVETSTLVLGLAAGVIIAFWLHSALALALGQAAGGAAQFLAASVTVRHDLRLAFDRADARELSRFATQVGGLNLFAYLAYMAPSWFTARVFGPSALGFYSRANLIVALPAEYAVKSIYKVIFSLYGRVREDLARTRSLVDEALTLTTGFVWPILALIAGAAPVIVAVLLGDRWDGAAPLIAAFALMAAAWVPCGLLTNAGEALGWMRIIAARQVAFFVCVAVTLAVAHFADLSLELLLLGLGVSEWLVYALTLRAFIARELLERDAVLRRQLVHVVLAATAFAASAIGALLLRDYSLLVQVAAQVVIGAAVIGTIAFGRRWIPATEVLAHRMGVPPGQNVIRAAWTGLR
jgi:O-antigen/teichoic acid export membrane protein